jgi:hypothetical protein
LKWFDLFSTDSEVTSIVAPASTAFVSVMNQEVEAAISHEAKAATE